MHPEKLKNLPLTTQIKNGSWAGKAYFKGLKFVDYASAYSRKGLELKNQMIKVNKKSSDFVTMQNFEDIEFVNCDADSLTHFFEPPKAWANLADCGDFPCTGPKNTIFSFKNTKWTGLAGPNALTDFNLIPTIPGYTDNFPNCVKMNSINGH